jgi:threonine synthase
MNQPPSAVDDRPACQALVRPNAARGLRCIGCGREHPVADLPAGCPHCAERGTPASVELVYAGLPSSLRPASSGYRWGAWLPYTHGLSLGEGDTPCRSLPRLARELGLRQVSAKFEGMNPTGSHKDRMSAQGINRALEVGARSVVLASSGNAAVSAAAYCAAAGLRCEVATYRQMPEAYVQALSRFGAQRVMFDRGLDRWAHVRRQVECEGAFALTNFHVPAVGSAVFCVEAYRAVALECVADGCVPDHILVPTARGDLLWGLYSGLRDLRAAGLIARLPKLWAVEPFVRLSRVLAGAALQSTFDGQTAQASIAGNTVTLQQELAVRQSGGGAVVVNDADAARGVAELAAAGWWVELCAGACVAALAMLRAREDIAAPEHALLVLTARGGRDNLHVAA